MDKVLLKSTSLSNLVVLEKVAYLVQQSNGNQSRLSLPWSF